MKRFWILLALATVPLLARATVTGTAVSASFTCSGSTGPYPFTFPISTAEAMTVTQNGTVLSSSVYTIAPVNANYDNGGSVTLTTACPSGQTLVLTRVTPLTQLTEFTPYMPALYANTENALDKLTEIDQELLSNGVICPTGGVTSVTGTAPVVSSGGTTPAVSLAAYAPQYVPNLAADSSTNNATALNAATAATGVFWLPSTTQGTSTGHINFGATWNIGLPGTSVIGQNWLNGTSSTSGAATFLNYTGASGNGITLNCHAYVAGAYMCQNNTITNLLLQGPNNATGVGIAWDSGYNQNNGNWPTMNNVSVGGFPQCLTVNGYSYGHFNGVSCVGSHANSTGWLIDIFGPSTNSNEYDFNGGCEESVTSGVVAPAAGFLRLQSGIGNHIRVGDLGGNCATGIWIGNYSGGGWEVANAIVEVRNFEVMFGPSVVVDQYSSANIIYSGGQGASSYLGPPIRCMAGASCVVQTNGTTVQQSLAAFTTKTPSTSGGTITAGQHCFGYVARNPAAVVGSGTVEMHSYISSSPYCYTFSGSSSSLVLTPPTIANATVYDVYEGATSTASSMQIIATGITIGTSYTVTGSETPGATAPVGNIPIATKEGAYTDVRGLCAETLPGGNSNYGNMVLDYQGNYTDLCTSGVYINSTGSAPSATAFTNNKLIYTPARPNTSDVPTLYFGFQSYGGTSTPTPAFSPDLLHPGSGTALLASSNSFTAQNSFAASTYFNGTVYHYSANINAPATAATNGANYAPNSLDLRFNAWSTTNSQSETADFTWTPTITATAQSPIAYIKPGLANQSGLSATAVLDLFPDTWASTGSSTIFGHIRSSSGYNCLQIDATGNITNTGSACGSGGSMVYPGAGIAVSTGSAWGTSLTAPTGSLVGAGQANTYTTGLQDFSSATMKLPSSVTVGANSITLPASAGTVALTSQLTSGTVTTSGSPASPNVSCFSSSTAIGPCTSANIQTAIGSGVYDASGAAAARQANLSLIAGTYVNGDMCTYSSSGTLLNCNTAIPSVGTWGALNYPSWASGTPFVKMTAAGTFALDTNSYQPLATNLTSIGGLANSAGWLYNNGSGTFSYTTPTATNVGLGSVTNDAQTKNSIVPNTFTGIRYGNNGSIDTAATAAQIVSAISTTAVANATAAASAAALSISGQTGLLTFTGLTSTNRVKTVRDAADTILELAGSYTPTGTWNWTSCSGCTWPTFNQNTSGTSGGVTGSSGVSNSVVLGNATSGTLTVKAQTGALGTTEIDLPAAINTPAKIPQIIASGSLALATSSITTATCQTVSAGTTNSAAATNVATTDVIQFTPNGSIKAVAGFSPATTGGFTITAYPTAGYVNFDVCNWTSTTQAPGAVTVNWVVMR